MSSVNSRTGRETSTPPLEDRILRSKFFSVALDSERTIRLLQPDHEKLEEVMNITFGTPVLLRDGPLTMMIEDIPQALAFLERWPKKYRGVVYETVRWGLFVAQHGQMSVETARKAFEGWARAHGVVEQHPPKRREPDAAMSDEDSTPRQIATVAMIKQAQVARDVGTFG